MVLVHGGGLLSSNPKRQLAIDFALCPSHFVRTQPIERSNFSRNIKHAKHNQKYM